MFEMRRTEVRPNHDLASESKQTTPEFRTLDVWYLYTPFVEHAGIQEQLSSDGREAWSKGIGKACPKLTSELVN
jgi:hypothetical protein